MTAPSDRPAGWERCGHARTPPAGSAGRSSSRTSTSAPSGEPRARFQEHHIIFHHPFADRHPLFSSTISRRCFPSVDRVDNRYELRSLIPQGIHICDTPSALGAGPCQGSRHSPQRYAASARQGHACPLLTLPASPGHRRRGLFPACSCLTQVLKWRLQLLVHARLRIDGIPRRPVLTGV